MDQNWFKKIQFEPILVQIEWNFEKKKNTIYIQIFHFMKHHWYTNDHISMKIQRKTIHCKT